MNRLGTDEEINTMLLQYLVHQREIVGGIRCRSSDGDHVFVDILYLLQIWGRIVDISRRHSQADHDAIVCVNGLVGEVMLPRGLPGRFMCPASGSVLLTRLCVLRLSL